MHFYQTEGFKWGSNGVQPRSCGNRFQIPVPVFHRQDSRQTDRLCQIVSHLFRVRFRLFLCKLGIYLHDQGGISVTHPGLERFYGNSRKICTGAEIHPKIMTANPESMSYLAHIMFSTFDYLLSNSRVVCPCFCHAGYSGFQDPGQGCLHGK